MLNKPQKQHNCIGKYYKTKSNSIIMITSITDEYTDDNGCQFFEVECIYIRIESDEKHTKIITNNIVNIDIKDREITEREFNDYFEKAILILNGHIFN